MVTYTKADARLTVMETNYKIAQLHLQANRAAARGNNETFNRIMFQLKILRDRRDEALRAL